MRPFLAALLLCYCVTMPVLVAFPMRDAPAAPAKDASRAPLDMVVQKSGDVRDDALAAPPPPVDQRVQVASLAPVDLPSIHNDPVSVKDIPTPRPRVPFVEQPEPKRDLLKEARKYIGTNPTGWASLWCAKFVAMICPECAAKVDNPNWARDYAALPHTKNPKPGALVVLKRGSAGHIGVLAGFDKHDNPIVISGNTGRRGHRVVAEGTYDKSRVIAYVVAGL